MSKTKPTLPMPDIIDAVISKYGRKTIKNTFAPKCGNEYFTHSTLFALFKWGFPEEELPEKAKQMLH